MSEEKQIKDIVEILELSKEEIENNNENITATLDLQDLKSLKNLYDLYNKEKALNEELQIRYKIENDKYKELKERINKSIEFINDDDTFFDDGESWQNVLYIERILRGE